MNEVRDHSVLKWIKPELDASLETARNALEAYIDEEGPETELESCIAHLHQVRGTLQLMQLYGAAMLAEEMEQVATTLGGLGEKKRKDSAEALMVGLAQLPDYLEKVESGSPDSPLLLLPLMNELRAARDASLLSEVALFAPDLDSKLRSGDEATEGNPDLPGMARKLRLQYHKALLNWYRDIDPQLGLKRIGDIFHRLEEGAASEAVRRTFQVARSTVAALQDGSIDPGIATKLLVGKVDREIKRIIDHGEEALVREPANDLLKNLLYYTACADSPAEVVKQVKQAFDLDNTLLGQAGASFDMHAPGRELLDSLRSAITTDLTAIKDQLDLFIRSKSGDLDRLQALQEPIRKLGDTLGMVGQGELRSRLARQADRVGEIVSAGAYPGEQDLMAMASDILFIETSLNNLSIVRRYTSQQSDQLTSSLPAGEFERLVDSVMHEAGIDMAHNKEAIINFIEHPGESSLLAEVPRRFRDIAGAFRVLTLDDAAGLMERLNRYVEGALLGAGEVPSASDLDAFADAVTGIEYYMEAVTEGRGIHPEILDVTRDALQRLAIPEQSPSPDGTGSTAAQGAASEQRAMPGETETEDDTEVEAEPGEVEQAEPLAAPEPAEQRVASVDKPALEDIDPEILEIFIEESEEELAVIQEYLPRWIGNRDDHEALTTFRRSFHTLKGSGRLVGAKAIGEYAWSVENLLNRVIDGTVEATPELTDLLGRSLDVLPQLIECQKQGTSPEIDVEPLMWQADALARPGSATEGSGEVGRERSTGETLDSLEDEIGSSEVLEFAVPDRDNEQPQEAAGETEAEAEPEPEPEPEAEPVAEPEAEP
ncbi:MAG: Hpt domain-containing protein, partial [Sedimenticola sp.]|nr:Hpt domain-containing protein [Sedimenticola sp.]